MKGKMSYRGPGGGLSEKFRKSVKYYLNDPQLPSKLETVFLTKFQILIRYGNQVRKQTMQSISTGSVMTIFN
jgi:hypothetical protein